MIFTEPYGMRIELLGIKQLLFMYATSEKKLKLTQRNQDISRLFGVSVTRLIEGGFSNEKISIF